MIYEYKRIRELHDGLVLTWWAENEPGQDFGAVVKLSAGFDVKTTISEVRRDIQRRLRNRRLIPLDRAPTNADYESAKRRWLHIWRDQPLT